MSNGFSPQVETMVGGLGVTAVIVVREGVSATWGDVDRPVNLRSIRKSLLSALYGAALPERRIDLASTLAALEIDDRSPALTADEKGATVRDLLMARSGVYHAAAYEPPHMKAKRPMRGAYAPGERWYYNNWDANVLGVVYEKLMGEDLFEGFARRIAGPIGMEDFSPVSGRRVFDPASDHPAQLFRLSARDLARFGLLFLHRGQWAGEKIIPTGWVEESTRFYSETDLGQLGYGYLWWVAPEKGAFGPGAFLALGAGGQALAVLPAHALVVVQLVETPKAAERFRLDRFVRLVRLLIADEL